MHLKRERAERAKASIASAARNLLVATAGVLLAFQAACGHKSDSKDEVKPAAATIDDPHAALPEDPSRPGSASDAGTTDGASKEGSASDAVAADAIPEIKCTTKKTNRELVTSIAQDLFRRAPNPDELKMGDAADFSADKFSDWALEQPEVDTGIAFFASNLFRLEQNIVADANDPADVALVGDLKQEIPVLFQRQKNKPWPDIFTTSNIFCTTKTAALYGYPVDKNTAGFVSCKMPQERAGILGTVSFLRAFSSAFYMTNSNRHRVSTMLYLAKGLELQAKTNGPAGSGRPEPLAACVPATDLRISDAGLVFGTAAVPLFGVVCSGCHSKFLAPNESAFMRFGPKGELLETDDIDKLQPNTLSGISKQTLKNIFLSSTSSCWNPDDVNLPPQAYRGEPGLGRVIAGSSSLASAIAIQIQQNLVNSAPDDNASAWIKQTYNKNGKTLLSAMKGFFVSDTYQCAKRGDK